MKKIKYYTQFLLLLMLIQFTNIGCRKVLDTKINSQLTEDQIKNSNSAIRDFGYAAYSNLRNGFSVLDNNLFAAATDDAEQTAPTSQADYFNNGSWNAFYNPDDQYNNDYSAIYRANYFLENSVNYKYILGRNRDTLSDGGNSYQRDILDIGWLRAENRVLRAYFYFDLIKRYGDVPFTTKSLTLKDNTILPKTSFNEIVKFIVTEIDAVRDSLQTNWSNFDNSLNGRITLGAALALKSRVLLYAASPLHNEQNELSKWQAAASAAYDVINLNQYSLNNSYRDLFISDNSAKSNETIWALRLGPDNSLEKRNYPIGTPGGTSGVTPSQNLINEYEFTDAQDPSNPYANRDPRLSYSIVTNNSEWNGRVMQIYSGGQDDPAKSNASRTGYYLKKFLNDNLNLEQDEKKLRNWIVFRYAEILLNYAEAMNESYGPTAKANYSLSALDALNIVRSRPDVGLDDVITSDKNEMRKKIKHERRIELVFEGHRWWDLVRWKDAGLKLNEPVSGVKILKTGNTFTYSYFSVEPRVFTAPKMYYYPIPQNEIIKSNGVLNQNPGW